MVVNLSGKSSKQSKKSNYTDETLQNIFSSGKNLEAVCIAVLVDRGVVSYDDLVIKHWPEFGKHGKHDVTIADVLRHEGGVPFFADPFHINDGKKDTKLVKAHFEDISNLERVIENSAKYDIHSKRHYHASTRGWILSGIIRRADSQGRPLGQFMRDEVCMPLSLNIYCGMSRSVQKQFDFADIQDISPSYLMTHLVAPALMGVGDPTIKAAVDGFKTNFKIINRHNVAYFTSVKNVSRMVSSEEIRAIEWPSGGMQANAKSVAKINAVFANGGTIDGFRLISEATVTEALSQPRTEYDELMNAETCFTRGGFSQFSNMISPAVAEDFSDVYKGFVGWCGLGGSVSLWHPEHRIAVGYTMNGKTVQLVAGPRSDRIFRAIQKVLNRIKV